MNVYWKPGTAIAFARNGSDNRGAAILALDLGVQGYYDVVTQVSASSQRTNAGVTRTLLKVEMELPRNLSTILGDQGYQVAGGKGTEVLTLHSVVTIGPMFSALMANAATKDAAQLLLAQGIGILIAALSGKDSANVVAPGALNPVLNGMKGLYPLDIDSGTYGAAS